MTFVPPACRCRARRFSAGATWRAITAYRAQFGPGQRDDRGVSIFEYVLLVTLVALVATGSLLFLGRSPSHVANNVGNNVVAAGNSGPGGGGDPPGGTSTGTPVKVWCTSGESGCTDPVDVLQTETIHFSVSGGTPPYTYTLKGQPSFVTLDAPDREIMIAPTNCSSDPGSYNVSLIVDDSATPTPNTGTLNFTLDVASC
jgi:Flp pilus assembly pilin Flp